MAIVQDRHALYYPYIHIRDANWLKATLLWFPQVRCMVPEGGIWNDLPEVAAFRQLRNERGQWLLESEDPLYANQAQDWLLKQLRKNEPMLRERFSHPATQREFGDDSSTFHIHGGKFLQDTWEFMQSHGRDLAWPVRDQSQQRADWFAVHPKVGEAMMAVLAISISQQKGLEIVTDDPKVHQTIVTRDLDGVFTELLASQPATTTAPTAEEIADDVALLVLTHGFDLSKLTPVQIANLINEGKDLRPFKERVMTLAQELPAIPDSEERTKRMKEKANQMLDEWRTYQEELPSFARDALLKNVSLPDIFSGIGALALFAEAVADATVVDVSPSTAALGIGGLLLNVWRIKRSHREMRHSPYHFLSLLEQAGASLVTSSIKAKIA